MSRPPEQQNPLASRWWVHLCQWLFRGLLFVWLTVVLGLALNVGATWLTTKGFDPKGTPLEWVLQHLSITLACSGCLLALTVIAGMHGRQDTPPVTHAPSAPPTQQSRRALIQRLRNEYRRQMAQSLQGHTMMALALQQRIDAVLSSVSLVSWRMDAPGEVSLPAPASIVQAYDDAGSGLLILGAPGAGKSTLLRELASELIIRAEQDEAQPIPVIVNLSSWAIKKPPLTTWLVDQLQLVYAVPRHLSQAWIEQDQLLLLLDGLDEVETSARLGCIEAINAYRGEHFLPLVVCSRSQEYLTQEGRLRLPFAVEVRSLTSEQVDTYLKGAGKPLAAVRAVLKSNATLRDLVTTPLMLSVVMLAYRGKTVKDLPRLGSAEDQQRQVFEHYVTRMLESSAREWHYAPHTTRQWLIWLAQQMKHHQITEFYLERLPPTWLPTKQAQTVYKELSGLLVMLVGGLVGGLYGELLGGLHGALVAGLSGVTVSGLVIRNALLIERASGLAEKIQPSEKLTWSWHSFLRSGLIGALICGLLFGLLFGLYFGLLGGLLVGLLSGMFLGLAGGLLGGLYSGLLGGLSSTQVDEHALLRPNQGIRTSGWNALRSGLLAGLVGGLLAGLVGALVSGRHVELLGRLRIESLGGPRDGLLLGLLVGLYFGLVLGGRAYLQHYFLRYLLYRSGAVPWRYVHFLEEATERILLQRVGGGYRFIHPLFLDYFASLETSAPSPYIEPPPSQQP